MSWEKHPSQSPEAGPDTILITGVGLVSPLGASAWGTFRALLEGRTLADRLTGGEPGVAGSDAPSGLALVRSVGAVATAQHAPDDPSAELAERATREAAMESGLELAGLPVYLASSKGAVSAWTACLGEWAGQARSRPGVSALSGAKLEDMAWGPHAYLERRLGERCGVRVVSNVVSACASALVAVHLAARRLRAATATEPVSAAVVTAESALIEPFVGSYERLGVLAEPTVTGYRQRPLSDRRGGLMLAEVGAAITLQRVPRAAGPGEIELVDTGVGGDGHDLIRTDPGMPALRHIASRLIGGRAIDMIHPHAPGTPAHDPAELAALADVFNAEREMTQSHGPIDLYASKGAIGHALGASGLASLVIACLCLRSGRRPPMPWIDRPLTPSPIPIDPGPGEACPTGTHAVFASGFGGHAAGAVIKRW